MNDNVVINIVICRARGKVEQGNRLEGSKPAEKAII